MSGDQALGVIALVLGLVLLALQSRIARAWSEREDEDLRRPLVKAVADFSPVWMRVPTLRHGLNRAWLTIAAAVFIYVGVRLLAG